jgi:ABC-type uncharacterized transport system permease subunit
LLLPLIAVACYLFGAIGLGVSAYQVGTHHGRGRRIAAASIAAIGVVVHASALVQERRLDPLAALSLGDVLALVALVIAVTAILMALRPRLRGMAALLLGIAAVLEAAFAFLTIGAVLAVAQVIVDRRLRSRQPLGWLRILTPVESVESGCFHSILAGFTVLTLALVTGAFFIENLFAQHLVHKVVLAIVAWVVFGILLLGRWRMGWRGRQALRWTLAGYALLGLSYFGSKLVLENVLGRHWG